MKRYNVSYMGMELHKNGEYVTYQGHMTRVRQLEIEIANLKERLAEYEDDSCIFHVDLGDEDRSPYSVEDD